MKKNIVFILILSVACLLWQCKDDPEPKPEPTISSIGVGALGAKGFPRQVFKVAGTNLDGAKVFFKNASGADVEAKIHSGNATEIYAFVPETAVTGQVRVETSNGQASSNFTVRTVTVSTFVGTGTALGSDGTGNTAGLGFVQNMCLHSNGNLYVAHHGAIRKITPAGVVTTTAGTYGQFGFTNGTGAAARFGGSLFLAVDASENIYVSDNSYHVIRKVTSAGVVTTLAGSTQGTTDGVGTNAKFGFPSGLVLVGNFLYVANNTGSSIRKVDITNATVTTLVTPALGADGYAISLLDVDADGTFYASAGWGAIRSISPAGVVNMNSLASFYANNSNDVRGFQDGFPANTAKFGELRGLAVIKSGTLKGGVFASDSDNNHIRFVYEGVSTLAGELPLNTTGSYAEGSGVMARFKQPAGIVCDATGNTIYVADRNNHRIRKIVISD